MPFFVIKKGLVLLEWKYFPTPKILDPFERPKITNIFTTNYDTFFEAAFDDIFTLGQIPCSIS